MLSWIPQWELYPKRKFKLVFSGFKAQDKYLLNDTNFELFVYYKNTYSIVSYSKMTVDKINLIPMNMTVQHSDDLTLFDWMAFPLLFKFAP